MAYTFSLTSLFANVVSNLFFFVQLRLEKTSRAQLDSNNLDLIHNFLSPNKNLNRFTKEISFTSVIFHLLHTHKLCSNSVSYTILYLQKMFQKKIYVESTVIAGKWLLWHLQKA